MHRSSPLKRLLLLHFVIVQIIISFSCNREKLVNAQRKTIVEAVYASGKIVSQNEYSLFALSNGTVTKKLVNDGDTVRKEQILFIISNDAPSAISEAATQNFKTAQRNISGTSPILKSLKLELESAAIKCRNDSLNYFRLKNLWLQGIGTQANVDNAFAAYRLSQNQKNAVQEKSHSTLTELRLSLSNARSQMMIAQSNLQNYYIRSESDGLVYQTFKEAGEAVRMNEPVALIGDKAEKVIRLAVDQQDIDKVQPGQKVLLKTDIAGNKIFEAVVKIIYPVMNTVDQTFRVDALFKASPAQPFVHNSVEANIIISTKSNVLVIQRDALRHDDSLLVLKQGKQQMLKIETGIKTLNEVEIAHGIDENTQIVLPFKK